MVQPQNPVTLITNMIPQILQTWGDALANAYRFYWDLGMKLMEGHWLQASSLLFVVFIFILLLALISGRWGTLGSFFYNFFYWGTLLLIGFIFGPETFANDYFKIVLLILWPVCYYASGFFLGKLGFI